MARVLHVQKARGVAGSERYLLEVLPALRSVGVDARFCALVEPGDEATNDELFERFGRAGVPVEVLRISRRVPSPLDAIAFARLVRRGGYDIVHTHLIHADVLGAMSRPMLSRRCRLVSTKHGYEEAYIDEHGLDPAHMRANAYSIACRLADTQMDATVAISRGLGNLFTKGGLARPDRMRVIHYGFDFGPQPVPEPSVHRLGSPQLVLVGRLVGFKGHRFALDAMTRVVREVPEAKLVIVGSGPLEEEIRSQVRAAGLEANVELVGYRRDAREFMAASDVVLVPSISEGLGVVFLEAIHAGKPVVAFDVPAGNEILEDRVSGRLVPAYDSAAYADAIVEVLADERRALELVGAADERLRGYFSQHRMIAETSALYEELLRTA